MNRLVLVLALLTGCAHTLSPAAAAVQDADPTGTSTCTALGEVTGTSAVAGTEGLSRARNEARENAAAAGATAIVWTATAGAAFPAYTLVTGRAYRCEPPPTAP